MGHLTNAKGFRVGKTVPWEYRDYRYKGEGLKSFYFYQSAVDNIKRKLRKYIKPLRFSFTYSHCKIKFSNRKILVKIYMFNGQFDTYKRQLAYKIWGKKGRLAKYLRFKQRAKKRRNRFTYYYFWRRPLKIRKAGGKLRSRLRRNKIMSVLQRKKRSPLKIVTKSNAVKRKKFEIQSTLNFWMKKKKNGTDFHFLKKIINLLLTFCHGD